MWDDHGDDEKKRRHGVSERARRVACFRLGAGGRREAATLDGRERKNDKRCRGARSNAADIILVHAHMLAQIIVPREVLATPRVRAFVRCDTSEQAPLRTKKWEDARFSQVCILRTCRFKCSPRAKHLPHPGTLHVYNRTAAPLALPRRPLAPSAPCNIPAVGTLRPRLFFVKFGTGTGTGRAVVGRARDGFSPAREPSAPG